MDSTTPDMNLTVQRDWMTSAPFPRMQATKWADLRVGDLQVSAKGEVRELIEVTRASTPPGGSQLVVTFYGGDARSFETHPDDAQTEIVRRILVASYRTRVLA